VSTRICWPVMPGRAATFARQAFIFYRFTSISTFAKRADTKIVIAEIEKL